MFYFISILVRLLNENNNIFIHAFGICNWNELPPSFHEQCTIGDEKAQMSGPFGGNAEFHVQIRENCNHLKNTIKKSELVESFQSLSIVHIISFNKEIKGLICIPEWSIYYISSHSLHNDQIWLYLNRSFRCDQVWRKFCNKHVWVLHSFTHMLVRVKQLNTLLHTQNTVPRFWSP